MLSKLESAYLAILRVAILVAATLALLVTIVVAAASAPSLLESAGFGSGDGAAEGSLRQFMEEKKSAAVTDEVSNDQTSGEIETTIDPDVSAAATNFVTYLGLKGSAAQQDFALALQGNADNLITVEDADANAFSRYGASVRALSDTLLKSTGHKLNEERVHELVAWHYQHFVGDLAASQARQAAARADLLMKLGVAGAAFLVFVLIIFVFIFVKIERNMRSITLVHNQESAEA